MDLNDLLDKVLRYLLNEKNIFHPAKTLFVNLGLEGEAHSVIVTLERNNHIELKANIFEYADIKITAEGVNFITTTSYRDQKGNYNLTRVALLSSEVDDSNTRRKLEFDKLKKEIDVLSNSPRDYSRYQ